MSKNRKRTIKILGALCIFFIAFILLSEVANASGLFPDDDSFSSLPLDRYQLDLYLSSELPAWRFFSRTGESMMNGIMVIFNGLANVIWFLNLLLSNLAGWLMQEAFRADLISNVSSNLASNMTALWDAFIKAYGRIILTFLMVYVVYVGVVKREATKAISACVNSAIALFIAMAFFAHSSTYIDMINDLSGEMSNTALTIGTTFIIRSDGTDREGVDVIRDMLWDIQTVQPWLILQFGSTDIDADRYNAILNNPVGSEERDNLIENEVEELGNESMAVGNVFPRIGYVILISIFNIFISIFVFILSGMMIFSQIMFITFASYLPISIILSLIPSLSRIRKKGIIELFNSMMMRVGVTMLAVVTFSISSMIYGFSRGTAFLWVIFLQLVCFAGIFLNIGKLLNNYQLDTGEQQSLGKRILRDPLKKVLAMKAINRGVGRRREQRNRQKNYNSRSTDNNQNKSRNNNNIGRRKASVNRNLSGKAGRFVGGVASTRKRLNNTAENALRGAKNLPTNAKYGALLGKHGLRKMNNNFKNGIVDGMAGVDKKQFNKRALDSKKLAQRRRMMNYSRALKTGELMKNGKLRPRLSRDQFKNVSAYKGNLQNVRKYNQTRSPINKTQSREVKRFRGNLNGVEKFRPNQLSLNKSDFTVSNEHKADKSHRPTPKRRIPRSEAIQRTSSRTARLNGEEINLTERRERIKVKSKGNKRK